jgi:type IV secretion system protein VirD4
VLFGQIAVVFGIVIAGVWGATQWTAAALGYQLRLGSPWFDLLACRSTTRGSCSSGGSSSMPTRRTSSTRGGAIAGGSGLLAVVVAIGMSVWRSRQSKLVTTYGSARWAERG